MPPSPYILLLTVNGSPFPGSLCIFIHFRCLWVQKTAKYFLPRNHYFEVHGLLAIGTCVFMLINKKDKFLIEIWTMRNSVNLYDIVQVYALFNLTRGLRSLRHAKNMNMSFHVWMVPSRSTTFCHVYLEYLKPLA